MVTYVAKIVVAGKIHSVTMTDFEAFSRVVESWKRANPLRPVYLFTVVTEK